MSGSQQLLLGTGVSAVAANYIEDVFSTWLYTGNGGTTQTINNGIDLTGKGGMVWVKNRTTAGTNPTTSSYGVNNHFLFDTARTNQNALCSSSTAAQDTTWGSLYFNFLANGFDTGTGSSNAYLNASNQNYATWTFRKQPKFFDVVTYTGNGSNRTIAHSLGSVPGCIIVKKTSAGKDWFVYHRSLGADKYIWLNLTNGSTTDSTTWNNTTPTSTVFSVGAASDVNDNGGTYVAYLFAHDAGGFGLTGTDNVISCGSYTGTGAAGNAITLGYEPQWVLIKRTDSTGNWGMTDTMREMSVTNNAVLYSNLSNAELDAGSPIVYPTATGFTCGTGSAGWNASGGTYIYIAIRRGPMKTPTSGTSVFAPVTWTSVGGSNISTNFPVDMQISKRAPEVENFNVQTRLIGLNTTPTNLVNQLYLSTNLTGGDTSASKINYNWRNNGFFVGDDLNGSIAGYGWAMSFQRAPGFFDVVCYTGNGSTQSLTHNLGVVPELTIVKCRSNTTSWPVYTPTTGAGNYLVLNTTAASAVGTTVWNNTAPTSSAFTVGSDAWTNGSGQTYVAYLFASCPGVSKVGSYTGNGSSQTIDCGFTGGARMVLIKRTNTTGDWVLFDSARGIVAGNDPALYLNSSAAQLTTRDAVDADSTGFIVNQTDPLFLNVNGSTYIFLAIA